MAYGAANLGANIPFYDFMNGNFKTGTAGQLGGVFDSFAGAAQDLFGAEGSKATAESQRAAAAGYRAAAVKAKENLDITEQSYGIRQLQTSRAIFQTQGSISANIAGNGFREAGSAADILADSAAQGALQKSLLSKQGSIDMNNIQTQIASLNLQAEQADRAADAADDSSLFGQITGAIKIAAGIAKTAMFFA